MPRRTSSPPKHKSYQPPSSCDSKRRYRTEAEAKKAAEEQELLTFNLQLSVYKCPLCGFWHLTSRKDPLENN